MTSSLVSKLIFLHNTRIAGIMISSHDWPVNFIMIDLQAKLKSYNWLKTLAFVHLIALHFHFIESLPHKNTLKKIWASMNELVAKQVIYGSTSISIRSLTSNLQNLIQYQNQHSYFNPMICSGSRSWEITTKVLTLLFRLLCYKKLLDLNNKIVIVHQITTNQPAQ